MTEPLTPDDVRQAVRAGQPGADKQRSDPAVLQQAMASLQTQGYVIVQDLLPPEQTQALREEIAGLLGATGRNPFEGYQTQRVYGLLARTLSCNALVEHPLVLDILDRLLLPNYLLSQLVAINILPGQEAQLLHHDDVLYPVPRPRAALSAATIWALDDFTAANGGTQVIPASHLWDDKSPGEEDIERAVTVEMPAGSMVLFLGTLWHGGGANTSERERLAVTAQYCQPWCRTVENFGLSTPLATAKRCSETLQSMLGFNIHGNLMGYVDGRHPKRLLRD